MSEIGAHVKGYNEVSIGVCYEGGLNARGRPADTRTPEQKKSLIEVLSALKERFPKAKIVGHYELGANKDCPVFCASKEYSQLNGNQK
jgi:N-acetylmuramoyl-L-alanine amidase